MVTSITLTLFGEGGTTSGNGWRVDAGVSAAESDRRVAAVASMGHRWQVGVTRARPINLLRWSTWNLHLATMMR
ncbi:MAG: hypothetical protein R2855_04645 [Thermomicrobiales bacterium]